MKKRRSLLVLLTLFLSAALLLQGCGSNAKNDNGNTSGSTTEKGENESAPKGGPVTLKVWGDLGNQAVLEEPYKKINEAFMAKNPDIKIQYDFAQNDQSLNVALQANELPDLFVVQGNKTPRMKEMVGQGFLLPLDDYKLDTSRFAEGEIDYATVDGKMYSALPSFTDTQLVYYNKELFEKNGIGEPANWDEFVQALDKLKAAGVTPISMPGKSEWDRSWLVYAMSSALANDALNAVLKSGGKVTDPALAKALQNYRDFAEKGYFGKDFIANDMAGAQFAFTNGKAAMIVDGTWNNQTYASSGLNVGRFILPNAEGKKIAAASFSNFMTYAVSAKSEHPDQAVKYIEFLNSLEAQQILEDATGLVPTLKDITAKNDEVKELGNFDEAGPAIYAVMSALASTDSNTADILMKDVIPKLFTSKITGEEAVKLLDESATYTD
ncbi:ABC transporter substrate-binding protein [Paenibacillus nasutitermitis]|nr:sugar ABC transporter substrate-binding protein [Paenibacillus nasutitermitis]